MPDAANCCSYRRRAMVWLAPNPCASTVTGCGPGPSGRVSQAAQRCPADWNDVAVVLRDRMWLPLLGTVYVLYITYGVRVNRNVTEGRGRCGRDSASPRLRRRHWRSSIATVSAV